MSIFFSLFKSMHAGRPNILIFLWSPLAPPPSPPASLSLPFSWAASSPTTSSSSSSPSPSSAFLPSLRRAVSSLTHKGSAQHHHASVKLDALLLCVTNLATAAANFLLATPFLPPSPPTPSSTPFYLFLSLASADTEPLAPSGHNLIKKSLTGTVPFQ